MFISIQDMGYTEEQINEMAEKLWSDETPKMCNNCGAEPGEHHKDYCDIAVCTNCMSQYIGCECDNPTPEIWSGRWYGVEECYKNKIICYDTISGLWMFDLNEFYRRAHENI